MPDRELVAPLWYIRMIVGANGYALDVPRSAPLGAVAEALRQAADRARPTAEDRGDELMYKGQVPIFQTGRRKPTARWCPECKTWHDTPRGMTPARCEVLARDQAPDTAFGPRAWLGRGD